MRSHEREGGKIRDANDEDKSHSGCKIAVAEESRSHKGLVRGKSVHEKQVAGRGGDDRLDPDLVGPKPVELLAAVEQDLHGADGHT